MERKIFQKGIVRRLAVALTLALCLVLTSSNPVAAQSLSEYFTYNYNVEFSKTQIVGSEIFYATVEATANCTKDLPWPYSLASEAQITANIIARHQTSGATLTLNSGYSVTTTDFPKEAGDIRQTSQNVSLQFPSGSQSGTYSVVTELIQARVKVALVWWTVTSHLPSSEIVGTVTYTASSVGGGGGGGGGLPVSTAPPSGTKDISAFVSSDGTFTETVIAESAGGKGELIINKNTKGLSREGKRLTEITMNESNDKLAPPENSKIIGAIYDLGPDGATFDKPITLTITYNESLLPEGATEESLVIATWDKTALKWVILDDSIVDPENNTIAAPVSHFTAFTILSYTRPATFAVSKLSIAPSEVAIGEEITINTIIANTGDFAGSYEANLKIDNIVAAILKVTLEGGTSEQLTYAVAKHAAGTYTVTIDNLSGTFVVRAPTTFAASELSIAPAEVAIGEEVTISTLITNTGGIAGRYKATLKIDNTVAATQEVTLEGGASERLTFTTAKDTVGTYTVTIDNLSGTFVVKRASLFDRYLLGGIIATGVAIIVVIYLIIVFLRRRA